MRLPVLAVAVAALLFPGVAMGQGAPMARPEGAVLSIFSESDVDVDPDMATINAGVVTQAATAEAAMSENAARMTATIAALKKAGIADKDIQTTEINLNPQYQYTQDKPPTLTGYQAQNTVSAKVRNLKKLGPAIDAAVSKGGNQLNGVSFGVDDPSRQLDQARQDAVRKARARAELYAAAAGMKVSRILAISEGGAEPPPVPYPMPVVRMASAEARKTPVEIGQVSLSASVSVTFELR